MKIKPSIILSIDWDYITGDCCNYIETYHSHCGYCKDIKEVNKRGIENKLNIDWRVKRDKLLNLDYINHSKIFVAESHANIISLISNCKKPVVYDYDAHRDRYDTFQKVHCGNWIYHLEKLGGRVSFRPTNIKDVGAIFICRSAPWTPKCMDNEFYIFIDELSVKTNSKVKFIGHKRTELKKEYKKLKSKNQISI